MKRLFIPEIFTQLASLEKWDEQLEFMRSQNYSYLQIICYWAWHPEAKFDVEIPDFKPDDRPMGFGDINLFAEIRRLYIFGKHSPIQDPKKKQHLLKVLLTSLPKEEAKVIVDLISGEIRKYPNFTKKLVSAVYPQMIPLEVVENKEEVKSEDKVEAKPKKQQKKAKADKK